MEEIAPRLKGVRWVGWETLHVTLRFLGDTPEDRVPELVRAIGRALAPLPPARVSLGGLGVFPNPRRPSVVWAGITEGDDWLAMAHAALGTALAEIGIPPEDRPFRAHLTLGRVPRGTRLPSGVLDDVLTKFASRPFGSGTISEATLFASTLTKAGAIHEPLARLPFRG
jgi:2'-5' RNA ligase